MDSQFETAHHEPIGTFRAILLAAVVSFALGAIAALASSALADAAKPNVVVSMTDKAPYYHENNGEARRDGRMEERWK